MYLFTNMDFTVGIIYTLIASAGEGSTNDDDATVAGIL
jgi:hypothetical protein